MSTDDRHGFRSGARAHTQWPAGLIDAYDPEDPRALRGHRSIWTRTYRQLLAGCRHDNRAIARFRNAARHAQVTP